MMSDHRSLCSVSEQKTISTATREQLQILDTADSDVSTIKPSTFFVVVVSAVIALVGSLSAWVIAAAIGFHPMAVMSTVAGSAWLLLLKRYYAKT